jgi:4-hydroxy-4-methyl-2-oxoglutarate aldolase
LVRCGAFAYERGVLMRMTEAGLPLVAGRFRALYTGALTDAMDALGYPAQTLPSELLPLRAGMRLAGPAFTVEGRPHPGIDYDKSIRRVLAMLGSVPAHHVVVYQTHDRSVAHLGELSVTSLKARGCEGAVIEGGCRDIEFILQQDFPVFCRYKTPQDCVPRWELTAENVPVTIGGVQIVPGDYVVADMDGIVVIPASIRDGVLHEAEQKVNTESEIRRAVAGGALPLEAYERFGTF